MRPSGSPETHLVFHVRLSVIWKQTFWNVKARRGVQALEGFTTSA